ncbi:MAG: hypothetical protein CM15mV5_2490 [uncultured marine virus]|nr:MAG: hypothetical protein CM15mV5_2490 [uncultured marine virus]
MVFVGVTKNGSATRNTLMENCIVLVVYLIQKLQDLLQLRFLEHTLVKENLSSFNNLYVFNRVISDDEVRDLYQTMKVHMGMS